MSNSILGGGGFHHVAIRVTDFDRTIAFYTDVLGFRERIAWTSGETRAIMLDAGDGNYLEVFSGAKRAAGEHPPEGTIIHFALRTTDLDGALERARAAGMEVTMEPKSLDIPSDPPTPVRIAFFKGPDGEVVELFQNELT